MKIILWEQESGQGLRKIIKKDCPDKIFFAVGPEGGFTEKEILQAKENGFACAGLGSAILRSETVSLAVLTMIRYEKAELG